MTMSIAEAVGKGIISVPIALWDGVKRTAESLDVLDRDRVIKIGLQNNRAFDAIKQLAKFGFNSLHSPMRQMIRIIIEYFHMCLSDQQIAKLFESLGYKSIQVGSKMMAKKELVSFTVGSIMPFIVDEGVRQAFAKIAVTSEFTLVSMEGTLYKAGQASDRLQIQCPMLYRALRSKNLDMLYFLVEKPLQKFINVIHNKELGLPIKIIGM